MLVLGKLGYTLPFIELVISVVFLFLLLHH